MPISQDRLIALVDIIDKSQLAWESLVRLATMELDEATAEFYATNGNDNPLASNILAHLQSLAAAVLDNPQGISSAAIETVAREREHFRIRRGANARAARAMRRKRSNEPSTQETGI